MGKAPSFQFYPTDIGPDLDPLTMEERGMYLTMMRHLWSVRGGMPIDEVEALLQKPWLSVGLILRRRFAENDGRITLEWMEEQREKQDKYRALQSEKGKQGGRPSRSKKGSLSSGKAKPNQTQSPRVGVGVGNGIGELEGKERAPEAELVWPTWAGEKTKAKWEDFKAYRWEQHKVRYKSRKTEQSAINILAQYYKSGPEAVAGLELAMGKTWRFPVDPAELSPRNGPQSTKSGRTDQDLDAELLALRKRPGGYGPEDLRHDPELFKRAYPHLA